MTNIFFSKTDSTLFERAHPLFSFIHICKQSLVYFVLFLLFLFACTTLFSQDKPFYENTLCIPKTNTNDIISVYPGFYLLYNEQHEQPNWVAYELTLDEVLLHKAKRTNHFMEDKTIATGSATSLDYFKSGYDRGHNAPAADMCFSMEAMDASFLFSNISPQRPAFNRGIWAQLEEHVRSWAIDNKTIYVVTGPILAEKKYPTIGINEVSIPEYFFKVILVYNQLDIKAIGFIVANEGTELPLYSFIKTIDEVESFSGFDFFISLPDSQEDLVEKQTDPRQWGF